MKPSLLCGIAVASTAAAAAGLYVFLNYSKKKRTTNRRLRHTLSIEEYGTRQRQYLNEFKEDLGNKNFFLGEEISSTDLQVFGQLASIYYVPKNEAVVSMMNENYPTLIAWLERMKSQIANKMSFRIQK